MIRSVTPDARESAEQRYEMFVDTMKTLLPQVNVVPWTNLPEGTKRSWIIACHTAEHYEQHGNENIVRQSYIAAMVASLKQI